VGAEFPEKFPTVYASCMKAGIDPVSQPIPIAPAAHYHMGGVHTDGAGRSSLDGLWACGEVAATGAHGANRLASNSLLEAVVFAARIADDIQGLLPNHKVVAWSGEDADDGLEDGEAQSALMTRLRQIMSRHVGVVREADGLREALQTFAELEAEARDPQLRNALIAARMIAAAALMRKESRGGHQRADFPQPDPALARRTFTTLAACNAIAAEAGQPAWLAHAPAA
ncbi:MAG TPA: FAD-binding protein, partial [Afifellaceae bacterium]|nr:FAD-binding protein [Afifellaceae bacterium]